VRSSGRDLQAVPDQICPKNIRRSALQIECSLGLSSSLAGQPQCDCLLLIINQLEVKAVRLFVGMPRDS
jgi:hypothetical protein